MRNLKMMDRQTVNKLNLKYIFAYDEQSDSVIVGNYENSRETYHSCKQNFSINSRKNPKRKFTISTISMDMWKQILNRNEKEYTLLDIQNVVNLLQITEQQVTVDNVLLSLRSKKMQIKL